MFTYSPLLVVIIGSVTCLFILFGHIWFGKIEINREKITPISIGRGIFHIFFAALSLFLLDAIIRLSFSDLLNYGHYKYILATVILCLIYSFYLMVGIVFLAPTWKTLVTFFFMCGTFLFLLISSFSDETVNYIQIIFSLLVTGVAVELVLNIIDIVYKKSKLIEGAEIEKICFSLPLWNLSNKLEQFYKPKGVFLIYCLFMIELICLFEGTTFFYWVN
jgi:hypothetical protein